MILFYKSGIKFYRKIVKRSFFNIYQYVAFFIIFPLIFFLWHKEIESLKYTILFLILPIITAYIIPAVGTNITNLWEFNTSFMIGKFRIYHGFVLGSVTGLFGLMFYKVSPEYVNILNSLFFALICGAFIAFWNWVYDIYAVKCGFIIVNNKPAYENKSATEIVTDYAPVYFYMFGFVYAFYIKFLQYCMQVTNNYLVIGFVIFLLLFLLLPTLVYICYQYKKHRIFGISKYNPNKAKEN